MNAVNTLARDQQEAEFAAAVETANNWQDVGRHIVLAMLRLDMAINDDLYELGKFEGVDRTRREAAGYIRTASEALEGMLEGIRSDFLCDQCKTCAATDEEVEAFDAWNDALEEEVMSGRELIKLVEREDYEAFVNGERK